MGSTVDQGRAMLSCESRFLFIPWMVSGAGQRIQLRLRCLGPCQYCPGRSIYFLKCIGRHNGAIHSEYAACRKSIAGTAVDCGLHIGLTTLELPTMIAKNIAWTGICALMLAGCGGGGGGDSPAPADPPPPPPVVTQLDWDQQNWDEGDWQ